MMMMIGQSNDWRLMFNNKEAYNIVARPPQNITEVHFLDSRALIVKNTTINLQLRM